MAPAKRTAFTPVALGYAAGERGTGIAYLRLTDVLLRVKFRASGADRAERAAGYAALTAAAQALRARGIDRVRFAIGDAELIEDLASHRAVPDGLVLPYVRLRCALNQLDAFELERESQDDLAQRARAEVAMHVAA